MKKFFKYFIVLLLLAGTGLYLTVLYTTQRFIGQKTSETGRKVFAKPDTTEIYILGTIHKPTEFFSYDSLYNVLERIKPDLILYEFDSTGFDRQMNLKTTRRSYVFPNFLDGFQQSNLEEIAVRKYLHHNPFAIVRPYEWAERDKFHKENNISSKPIEIFALLDKLEIENKLNQQHKEILRTFYTLTERADKFGDSTLYEINSTLQDSITEQRQTYQYHEIKKVIDENANLQQYRGFYKINEAYWDIRNKAMVENIIKYVKLSHPKRIVVLNGYFHRYFLRKELLNKQDAFKFKLKEIDK